MIQQRFADNEVKQNFRVDHSNINAPVDVKILVGGRDRGKAGKKVVPNLNASFILEHHRNEEQYAFNINRKNINVKNDGQGRLKNGVLTIDNESKEKDVFYVDDKGLVKWDIDYFQLPESMVVDFELQTFGNIDYVRQPFPLEIFDKIPKDASKKEYELYESMISVMQPEMFGAYVMYCDKQNHFKSKGKTIVNYASGRLGEIRRPICIDAKGQRAYANLFIDAKKDLLRITLPQKFMENAAYPVKLDPTLGYTSTLAWCSDSTANIDSNYWLVNVGQTASAGVVDSFHTSGCNSEITVKMGLYDGRLVDSNLIGGTGKYTTGNAVVGGYTEFTAPTGINVTTGVTYWIAQVRDTQAICCFTFDWESGSSRMKAHTYADELTHPLGTVVGGLGVRIGMYITYSTPPVGDITVNINGGSPPAGAQWSIDSGSNWHNTGVTETLDAGSYTITFSDVSGWEKPDDIPLTITDGDDLTENVSYVQTGSVTTTITPIGAVSAGAQWRVKDQTPADSWKNSGVTFNIAPGTYTIEFLTGITGYESPADISNVVVTAGNDNPQSGVYNVLPIVVITTPTTDPSHDNESSTSISLGGTSSDSDGTVQSVTYNLTGATLGSGACVGTSNWTVDISNLEVGVTNIEIIATDDGGATGSDTIAVQVGSTTGWAWSSQNLNFSCGGLGGEYIEPATIPSLENGASYLVIVKITNFFYGKLAITGCCSETEFLDTESSGWKIVEFQCTDNTQSPRIKSDTVSGFNGTIDYLKIIPVVD